MYLLIILLPLLSSLITGFGGRWLGFYGVSLIACSNLIISFILSLLIFFEVSLNNYIIFIEMFPWLNSGELLVNWNLLFDKVTATMLVVVTFISTLVHLYSIDYMQDDPHFPRFMSFLGIFTFFMLILVTSGNLIQLFLGWEGVGLASYLLINFWFTRLSANKAAIKALIVNRIGDSGVLMAIFLIIYIFGGSLDFNIIFSLTPFFNNHYLFFSENLTFHSLTLIGFFLLVGAVGKSAQLGLHTWLPDAMEGPTPVSALIHAATMVTAGVFLIIRFSPLIEFSPITLNLLVVFGSFTAFFAAFTGTFQNDLKKVIAYSTCSQLGYMIFCCGMSCYNISLFHLFNHAFFKALLFLSAGSVIHAVKNEQDMRRMGSLISFLPITYSAILIGSLALTGFPFLSGFYSKDLILETANIFRNNNINDSISSITSWFGTLAAFFTSFYSFRLIYLTFLNNSNINRILVHEIKESSYFTTLPLIILIITSIFVGYLTKDFFVGVGTDCWNFSILIWPYNNYLIESEFLQIYLKWLPFFFTLLGFILSSLLNLSIIKFSFLLEYLNYLFFFINKKWFFDFFYNNLIVYPLLKFGYLVSFKNLDRGFIELIGPVGVSNLIKKIVNTLILVQTGQLTHYIFLIIMTLLVLNSFIYFITFLNFSVYLIMIFFILNFYLL